MIALPSSTPKIFVCMEPSPPSPTCSMESIFKPQAGGRLIDATTTPQGVRVAYHDNAFGQYDEQNWHRLVLRQNRFSDSVELSRAGLSLLAGRFRGDARDGLTYLLRFACLTGRKSWTLQTNNEQFWRSRSMEAAAIFRSASRNNATEITLENLAIVALG